MKYYTIIFIFIAFKCFSQDLNIKGVVRDTNNNPLSYVNIIIYDNDYKVINYQITNTRGEFNIDKKGIKVTSIELSAIGFKTIKINVNEFEEFSFMMEEEIFELKEVEVMAKIYKDTVNVSINKNLPTNATLKEILKKNSELEISENGAIFFEGKPIYKILINKKEVFINQNNLALENITNEMINNIQIINNYKDKFSFDFDNRKNSVINIATKDSFKGVLKSNIELSGGYKNAFLVRLKSFYFSDKLNLFITNNSNNVLERDFKYENNNPYITNNSSTFLKNINNDFSSENRNVTKSFLTSTSIILRKERMNSKFSIVFYQNYLKTFFDTKTERFSSSTLINNQIGSYKNQSNANIVNFNFSTIFKNDFILTYDFNIGSSFKAINNRTLNIITTTNESEKINELSNTNTIVLNNNLILKKKINEKLIILSETNLYNEFTDNLFLSKKQDSTSVNQNINFKSGKFKTNLLFDLNYKKMLSFNSGIQFFSSTESIDNINFQNTENKLSMPFTIRGDKDNFNYFFKVDATYWKNCINNESVKNLNYPFSFSSFYKINKKKNINVFFEKNYNKQDVLSTLPILVQNSNIVFLSKPSFNNQLSVNKNYGMQYTYYNFSKSLYLALGTNLTINKNSLTSIFKKFESNILIFDFALLNNQKIFNNNVTFSKGYHITDALHKVTFYTKYEYLSFDNNISNIENFQNINLKQKYKIGLEPNKSLIKEIEFIYQNSNNKFYQNNEYINNFVINKIELNTTCESNKLNFNLKVFYEKFILEDSTFDRKDIDLSINYKLNQYASLMLNGKNLISLYSGGNNVSNIDTTNNQGLITQTTNPNILGYILTGIQLKF